MRKKIDICKKCGREQLIVNNTHCLCRFCNHIRLYGMTEFELKCMKRAAKQKNYRKKATGEKALFLEIWNERPHVCTKCNKKLYGEPKIGYFSHIKSKGAFPNLRLEKSNIEIRCENCHFEHEFGAKVI